MSPKKSHPTCPKLAPAALLLAFAILSTASLTAQVATQPSVPSSDPKIVLSPFTVESTRDYGYISTNSQSGGRLATKLKDTPASISVLNAELLADVGAFDVQDALKWAPNAYAATESDVNPEGGGQIANGFSELAFGQTTVRIRGIRQATVAINYFPSILNSDTYNTERLDVSRGPNALLFGDASLGGVVNISTKRAGWTNFARAQYQATSYGGQGRASVDVNRVLSDKLAVRFAALRHRLDGWRDYLKTERDGMFATVTLKPTRTTQVRLDGEWGRQNNTTPTIFLRENASLWDHTTTQNTVGQAIVAATGLITAGNTLQFDLSHPELGVTPLTGLAMSNVTIAPPVLPLLSAFLTGVAPVPVTSTAVLDGRRTFFTSPGYQFATRNIATRYQSRFSNVSGFIEQTMGDNLFLEIAGNAQTIYADNFLPVSNRVIYDVNRVLPVGVTINGSNQNPDFLHAYTSEQMRDQVTRARSVEGRVAAIYNWRQDWFHQRIGVLGSARRTDNDTRFMRIVRTNGTNRSLSDASNAVVIRAPIDKPALSYLDLLQPGQTITLNGAQLGWEAYALNGQAAPLATEAEIRSAQVFASGSWLKGERIHTTVGVRRDYYTGRRFNTPVSDPVTTRILSINQTSDLKQTLNSPSAGIVVDVAPGLGVYANTSKTFAANIGAAPTFTLESIPSRIGSGTDFGVKFSFLGGRLSGAASYYRTKEINNLITSPNAAVNGILNATNSSTPAFGGVADTQTASAKGVELEVLANLTRNWTLMLNGGRPTSELRDAVPFTKRFVADNRTKWIAAAAAIGGTAPATVANNLITLDNFAASFRDGARVQSVRDYTANVFTRYRFSTGRAKGFFVGAGANFYGESYLGFNSVLGRDVFGGAFHLYSALAGYSGKLGNAATTVQLNANNLLDETNYSAVGGFLANGMPNSFRVSAPREFRLTATVRF